MPIGKGVPSATSEGKAIRIRGIGSPNERIDIEILRVVGGVDQHPAAYTKINGHLDGDGIGDLTSDILGDGTYHVIITAYPPGQPAVPYNRTVVIPPPQE